MTSPQIYITSSLISAIRKVYRLDWNGIHGASHWARVRLFGIKLSEETGANRPVVELFALLHDSCRLSDGTDPEHGARAAEFANSLRGSIINITDTEFELLAAACRGHTHELSHHDITVKTCWDADRLDLWRFGIRPDPGETMHTGS